MATELSSIKIRGASEHNLKHIDIDLPREKLIVLTGLSGSGKSSLAFDTIYAEGQRRYVESLSAYARQFLELMSKPEIESIEGLSPAIAIEQKTTSRNPRSTVATVTEIYDYMRLLWARVGIPYSPATGLPIESQSVTQMVDRTMKMEPGRRFYLLAPVVRGRKGEYRKEFAEWLKRGFQRVRVDGEFHELENIPTLDRKLKHDIDVVVDRLVMREGLESRLASGFEIALDLADGLAVTEIADPQAGEAGHILHSARFACPESGFTLPEIEPRLFSFNNPHGACPECDGLGVSIGIDPQLVIPDQTMPIGKGAIAPWSGSALMFQSRILRALAKAYDFALDTRWCDLPEKIQQIILYGTGRDKVRISFFDKTRRFESNRPFEGVIANLERRYRETDSAWIREEIGKYQSRSPCLACSGFRLRPEPLCVKLAGSHIGEITALSIEAAGKWFAEVETKLSSTRLQIAERILKEIRDRLQFLEDVGLDYLGLSRSSGTLSGGESQRIRLASQIGSGLTGVLYVLDEPSIGLHQCDNARLLKTLEHLRDLGNTVIVVEHDEEAILSADHVVDMGPRAGLHGGEIVVAGTAQEVMDHPDSLTGHYLSGAAKIPLPLERRQPLPGIVLSGVRGNNLKGVDVEFPLGVLSCVTGVSGSGKSTLVMETLYRALARHLSGSVALPSLHDSICGVELIDKVIHIDQSPIGRTPRSNPATYTGAFSPIRNWFAGLPEAKARGYGPGRFSFNVRGGRCEACKGDGVVRIEMHFLPDIYVQCEECRGQRYNRETLEIKFKGKSISDILDLSVSEAREFFASVPAIRSRMEVLDRVGMGYVRLGQSATTLSGGEAQRIKLARELSKRATGRTFYILDEPTTGLHFEDVRRLLEVLQELVDGGNTVVVIEHNLDVIKSSDWVIDLGPGGGDRGGELVFAGTPEQLALSGKGETSEFLSRILSRYHHRSGLAADAAASEAEASAKAGASAAKGGAGGAGASGKGGAGAAKLETATPKSHKTASKRSPKRRKSKTA